MADVKKALGRPPTMDAPRETILAHAATLFAENGFELTSLNDIARSVGVSKAAVYHYFSSKQALYEEIIVGLLDGLHEFVTEAIGAGGSAEERLALFMRAHATYFENNYTAFATLLHGVGGVGPKGGREIEVRDRYEAVLRGLLRQGISDGRFQMEDVGIGAKGILAVINWMVRWYKPDGQKTAAEIADIYFAMIYKGIRDDR